MVTISKRNWSDKSIDEIISLYEKHGWTITEISRKFATKPGTISKILKSNNVRIKRSRSKNRLLNEDYFKEINSCEKAYFLGLIFTDGSVIYDKDNKRAPNIRLELSEVDKDILDKFKVAINSDSSLVYNKRSGRKRGTFSISFRSLTIAKDLEKFGIVQNKTENTHYILDCVPEEYLCDFIRGVIDGDGSLYNSMGSWHISFTAHYKSMVESFENICTRLIDKPSHYKPTCYNGIYKVTYNGKWAKKIAEICYKNSNLHITRKHRKAMEMINEDNQVDDIVYSTLKNVV